MASNIGRKECKYDSKTSLDTPSTIVPATSNSRLLDSDSIPSKSIVESEALDDLNIQEIDQTSCSYSRSHRHRHKRTRYVRDKRKQIFHPSFTSSSSSLAPSSSSLAPSSSSLAPSSSLLAPSSFSSSSSSVCVPNIQLVCQTPVVNQVGVEPVITTSNTMTFTPTIDTSTISPGTNASAILPSTRTYTPRTPYPPLSADPFSLQTLAGIVEADTQIGVDIYGTMPVVRVGSDKVKIAWCTGLRLMPSTDMDEWFIKFERFLIIEGVDRRLWYKAFVQRCLSDLVPILERMPKEDCYKYDKLRDKICNVYGSRAPLVDIETKIREIPQKGLTIDKLITEINFLLKKHRRIAARLGRIDIEFSGPTVLTVIKSCLSPDTDREFRYQLDQYITSGIDYEVVRLEVEGRLYCGGPEEVLSMGKIETAPIFPFKHSSIYLEDEDRVKPPHKTILYENETDSDKEGFGSFNKSCFYCNQKYHSKQECPIRKYHQSIGKVLVDRNRIKSLVTKLTNRSRNAREVFFIRRSYIGRFNRNCGIKPQGPVKAIIRKYRRRNRAWDPSVRRHRFRTINKVNVIGSINEASENESEDAPSSDTDIVSDDAEYIDYSQAFEDSTKQVFSLEEILQEELLVIPQGMTARLVIAPS